MICLAMLSLNIKNGYVVVVFSFFSSDEKGAVNAK